MTMKPIADRAELTLDLPEKAYMGSFGPSSSFEATTEPDGVTLRLTRHKAGTRAVELHLHWHLFADILRDLGDGLTSHRPPQPYERALLRDAVAVLATALEETEQA